jgi:hypothetical protein
MKIGINLVGVSYNDKKHGGRYRNYRDAIDSFFDNIVNPLRNDGHEVYFYIFSYHNKKQQDIINDYNPVKYNFVDPIYNKMGGGDRLENGMKIMSVIYINSLQQLIDENLDLIISTRFDIKFIRNPFIDYKFDFTKCNFLWREPEYVDLPLVNDTFIVFPHSMTRNLIDAITTMEFNPPMGINVAMHNLYLPMVNQVGRDKVQWVCDEFVDTINNKLYTLTRHE